MDGFSKLRHGGEESWRDELAESARVGILRMDGGTSIMVYPLCKVTLGQAIVVVAGRTVFCLEAAWEGMTEEDRERFRQAAAKGTGWIDRQADIPTLAGRLTRGGRWCAHKGYSREAKRAIRDPEAVAFRAVRPSQQSAGTIVVRGQPSDAAQYCDTCGGMTEASRRCSPNGSGMGQEDHPITLDMADRQLRQDMEEKAERDVNRQIREESIESDQGAEPWMTIGRQTMHRVTEITDAQRWGEQGSEATVGEEEKDGRRVGSGCGVRAGTGGGCCTEERWNRMEKWMMDNVRENVEVREELERMRTLMQGEKGRWEKMLEIAQEYREETYKARRETSEGIGELKKWLARLGNENKEGGSIGFKNQAVIMDSLSKLHLNHNVSREDHKTIYGEVSMLETTMGSTVRNVVSEVMERLRLDLNSIFEALAEDMPRLKEGSYPEESDVDDDSDTDTETQREQQRDPQAWKRGHRGTNGGKRGIQGESGKAGNPINLVTPARTKEQAPRRKSKAGAVRMELTERNSKTENKRITRKIITRSSTAIGTEEEGRKSQRAPPSTRVKGESDLG